MKLIRPPPGSRVDDGAGGFAYEYRRVLAKNNRLVRSKVSIGGDPEVKTFSFTIESKKTQAVAAIDFALPFWPGFHETSSFQSVMAPLLV